MTAVLLQTMTALQVSATTPAAIWFPTAPGVTSLPAAPAVTVNPTPYPPNSVAVPAGFDRGNLQALFGSILPYGTAAVWPREMNATTVLPPYNEIIPTVGETRTACDVLDFPYAFTLPGATATLQTTTALRVVSLWLIGSETLTLGTTTACDVSSLFQVGIHQVPAVTTTQLHVTTYGVGLLFFDTSCAIVVAPQVSLEVTTTSGVVRAPDVVLTTGPQLIVVERTYFSDWSWQNYEWDADTWPEGWAN